jgi:hypothetical protein
MNARLQDLTATAIERACRFLVKAQALDGFWRDYALPPGLSSQWVTAFVGYALTGLDDPGPHSACVSRALAAMRSSCRASGWGYNATVATDADTTSWAVRWFVKAKTALPIEPISCLKDYLGPQGGARTFASAARYGRWTMEHVDVTAVLGLALKEAGIDDGALEPMRKWTLDQRNGDGLWTPFWWTFEAYATARVLEFLAATGGIPADVVAASRRYLQGKADGATPLETANLLMMASRAECCPDVWISSLLSCQRADGAWPPSRVLKVPDQKKTRDNGEVFEDMNGLMSTAMALMALSEVLREAS